MTVRAKFIVESKTEVVANAATGARGWSVKMRAVWEGADLTGKNVAKENHIFGEATPSGALEMFLTDERAASQFRAGDCQYLDFTPAGVPAYVTFPPTPELGIGG